MVIKISKFEELNIKIITNIENDTKEKITYDLHAGNIIKYPGDSRAEEFPNKLYVAPSECVRIQTEEEINIPNSVFGIVCSRASLTQEGLMVANLKVDPKFHGNLDITVFNVGKNTIEIDRNMPLCSVFFQLLDEPLPTNAPPRKPPSPPIITKKGIRNIWAKYKTLFWAFFITFILSVIGSLIATGIYNNIESNNGLDENMEISNNKN